MESDAPKPDADLDARLRDIGLPDGLLRRLREIALADEDQVDAALRDVAVPPHLRERLEKIPRKSVSLARWRQFAAAACLVVGIGICYVGAMFGFLFGVYRSPKAQPPRLVSRVLMEGTPLAGPEDLEPVILPLPVAVAAAEPLPEVVFEPQWLLLSDSASGAGTSHSPFRELDNLFAGPGDFEGLELLCLATWPRALGSPPDLEDSCEFVEVEGLVRKGVRLPPQDGVDTAFLIRTGFHPFIALWPGSPGVSSGLQESTPPLEVGTSSYDRTRAWLELERRPPPTTVRTEEFLRAVDYDFPPPKKGAISLVAAGGPSPFRQGGRWLMQIGVQARQEVASEERPPADLTVVLDISGSMGEGGRFEMVRRALRTWVDALAPQDRISLLTFSEHARVLAENATAQAKTDLLDVIDQLEVETSTNLLEGLRRAYQMVSVPDSRRPDAAHHVVLISDARADLDPHALEKIEKHWGEAAARGITLHTIQIGRGRGREGSSAGIGRLAKPGKGEGHRASYSEEILWALREIVSGKSMRVASAVRLRVAFNPHSVAAYRLLGHELGDLSADPSGDFFTGQQATVLYELQLRQGGPGKVAAIEVDWRDAVSGEAGRLSRHLRRGQFVATPQEAPLWWQAGAVVAETAEILRGSPFVEPVPLAEGLQRVANRSRQVDSRLFQWRSYRDFTLLIDRARQAKPHRNGARR